MSELISVSSPHFAHYRRQPESRRWSYRCLVIATQQIHLLDLVQQELTDYPEAIEGKIAHRAWRKSGMFVATLFFQTASDALAFRERNYENDYCVIAGPIRKPANRTGNDQAEVPGARSKDDAVPQTDARQAAQWRQLVAQEQDMALYLDGFAFA